MSVESLAQALLEAGILDAFGVESKANRARSGRALLDDILSEGDITESSLIGQLARALSVPRYDPKERQPEPEALQLLDLRTAEEFGVLPVAVRGSGGLLWVAMCDPTDESLTQEIARRAGRRVKACLIGPKELTRALQQAQAAPPQPAPQPMQFPASGMTGVYRAPMMPQQMPPMAYGHVGQPVQTMMSGMPMAVPLAQAAYPYGYGAPLPQPVAPPPPPPPAQPTAMYTPGPAPRPAAPVAPKTPDQQRLEDELAQAKQVVKVLVQLLVERGLVDGEELKRRLRAERDKR